MIKENEKITKEVNELLIDRIRKYQSQNISQLINSPNDEDTNNSYLGGLINFVGEETNNLDDEINNDLDKITINEIFIEPQLDNEYHNESTDEFDEQENYNQQIKISNNKIKIETDSLIKGIENKEKEETSFINPFIIKRNTEGEGIRILLTENFNNYLDLIGTNYEKYDNNHFPKIIVNEKNNTKKVMLNNLRNKIYYTKEGEKIIVNDEIYDKSLAYLKNKEIFNQIPDRFKKNSKDFTLDFNLLDETIENLQMKIFEYIERNKLVSTSMSKITLYCTYLSNYIHNKFEPFSNSINFSYEKINRNKMYISEIKTKAIKNSRDIILKKIKMGNSIQLIEKLKRYLNIKLIMNNLESLISEPKNYKTTFDMINKCKEEIEKIKIDFNLSKDLEKKIGNEIKDKKENKKNMQKGHKLKKEEIEIEIKDPIVELFEKRLVEFINENEINMSEEYSKVLNNYFNNFLLIENESEIKKKEKLEIYKKYNFSEFILEKISSFSDRHSSIIFSLYFPPFNEEISKIDSICDYYIESNLLIKLYEQLRGIFSTLSENIIKKIYLILKEKIIIKNEDGNEEIIENEISEQKEKKENKSIGEEQKNQIDEKNNNDKRNEDNEKDEICLLLCLLLSKIKLNETITLFIEILLKKIENKQTIETSSKQNILKEINEIKIIVKNNINNFILEQIKKCLHLISSFHDLNLYINNFYLVLEMLGNEISNYYIEEKNEQYEEDIKNLNEKNNENKVNNFENNRLSKIIIEEQKYFIENWLNYHLSIDSKKYNSWESLKEIPPRYQTILNVFFNFDLNNNCMKDEFIIAKFPIEKLNLIKEEEEKYEKLTLIKEEKDKSENDIIKTEENLLSIKDGEKPEIKIKITQISLEIIDFTFDLIKMFSIFHKECFGFILENYTNLIIFHLNFQIDQIYSGQCGFSISQQEICMSYGVFLLIEYIYEHIKNSEFFVTIAENSDQKIYDKYLDLSKNISDCCDISKDKIEDLIENHCISETLTKLNEIKLPYYNVVSGDVPVNTYALHYVTDLKSIYSSMLNCFEENFVKKMINKTLEDFFGKFEEYIFHGKKIEDENCLKQFKKDMVFLRKNLIFIKIIDLTELIKRIDKIMKIVLPESLRNKKK